MSTYQGSISLAKVKDGEGGTPGTNTATVYLYQRATSAPQKPSGDLTYTFSTGVVSGSALGNWKQNIAELTGTNPIYFILALASSTEETDTIESGDWKGPSVLAQDGQDGQNGRGVYSVDMKFINWTTNTEAQKPTTSTSGWSENVPVYNSSKPYYYVWVRTNYNDNSTPTDEIYLDNGLSDANKNAATANSISQAAEENAQGAMSIASNTRQHFWWIGQDYSTAIPAGAYMTQVSEDSFKGDPTGKPNLLLRSDSVNLRWGNRIDAQLINTGLKVAKGGVEAGTKNSDNYIYVWSEDDSTNHTFNINSSGDKGDWRIVAGKNFGVDKAGNLYASNAHISGTITVGDGSNVYSKDESDTNLSKVDTGLGIKWNASTFAGTWNPGEAYFCKYDSATGAYTDANGWVMFNGVKRTVPKGMQINPNSVIPYNVRTYMVLRLSSASATTGTLYYVYYNSGWKSVTPATPVVDNIQDWTWEVTTDIILCSYVEPGSEAALVEYEQYTPVRTAQQITNGNTAYQKAAAAQTTANGAAAKSQRIYYRSSSSTKPTGYPTTWVTEEGNKWNSNATTVQGWSRKVTPLSDGTNKYLYLWTATQTKTASNTVVALTADDIALDDTTTVIDGGQIITGSVTANQIAANAVIAEKIKAGAVTADKITVTNLSAIKADMGAITAGTISKGNNIINFNNDPATLEFKNASSWSSATQGIKYDSNGLAIKGTIYATSGEIGGWTLSANDFWKKTNGDNNGSKYFCVNANNVGGTNYVLAAATRESGAWSYKFYVNGNGKLYASDANITGAVVANTFTAKRGSSSANNAVVIDSGGMKVYNKSGTVTSTFNGDITLASDAATVTIGKTGTNDTYNTVISSTGLNVRNNATSVAWFGNTVRIGNENDNHILINSDGINFKKTTNIIGSISQISRTRGNTTYNNTMCFTATEYFELVVNSRFDNTPQLAITKDMFEVFTGNCGLYVGDNDYNGDGRNDSVVLNLSGMTNIKTMIKASNTNYSIWFGVDTDGFRGIADDGWLICRRPNNHIYLPSVYTYTGSNAPNVVIYGTGETLRSTSSSRRYKREIENIKGAEALYEVKVRQFKYRDDYLSSNDLRYNKTLPGFIVEELEEVYPIAIDYENEQPEDWNFRYIIPGMLKLIQDQHKEIEELKSRIS